MSNNDRKAIAIIIYLQALQSQGHFMQYSKKIGELLNNIIESYKPIIVNPSDHDRAYKYIKQVEDRIEKENIDSSVLMMLSITIAIAEEFMRYVKDSKYKAWSNLYDYCKNNLSINYYRFEEELDKASEVSEIIYSSK